MSHSWGETSCPLPLAKTTMLPRSKPPTCVRVMALALSGFFCNESDSRQFHLIENNKTVQKTQTLALSSHRNLLFTAHAWYRMAGSWLIWISLALWPGSCICICNISGRLLNVLRLLRRDLVLPWSNQTLQQSFARTKQTINLFVSVRRTPLSFFSWLYSGICLFICDIFWIWIQAVIIRNYHKKISHISEIVSSSCIYSLHSQLIVVYNF